MKPRMAKVYQFDAARRPAAAQPPEKTGLTGAVEAIPTLAMDFHAENFVDDPEGWTEEVFLRCEDFDPLTKAISRKSIWDLFHRWSRETRLKVLRSMNIHMRLSQGNPELDRDEIIEMLTNHE